MVMQALIKSTNTDVLTEPGQLYAEIDIDRDERLTKEMRVLLRDIRERFKPETDLNDLCVLYEVTKFKGQDVSPPDFWEHYDNIADLSDTNKLVNINKMDVASLPKSQRLEWIEDRMRDEDQHS